MKRFHVHLNVDQLDRSIRFYTSLFGAAPTVLKPDYAKWMLDDPHINFAISQRGHAAGLDHLGMQVEDEAELEAIGARLQAADALALEEKATVCCYAHSDKYWAEDPQGVRWESFRTLGEATTYSRAANAGADGESGSCCGPATTTTATCCGAHAGSSCC
ncbi:MAG: VOC family protein [Pseudomonadota bacterium]|jgi:catechol 2,3-dioxygenase-like lactoylglutathione lyase family enzyme|nr:VOC family protein [Xanthomonadaceae bacterium]MDE2249057.1 VOC family protein [Xanthomonadaceae bacterium]MDE3210344.1 VOC family protein [Pseudomonadota bacterium]